MTLQRKGVVIVNVTNIYLDANVKSEVVSQAIIGTTCTVKLNKKGWYNIQLPDTYLGWVPAETVRLYAKQDQPYASHGRAATMANLFANINEGPSVDSPLLTTATTGRHSRCRILSQKMDGSTCVFPMGKSGGFSWEMSSLTTPPISLRGENALTL